MSDTARVRKPVEFTCTSVTRVSKWGHFVKGQKVVVFEDEPRIGWFRSGGFKAKELPPLSVAPSSPEKTDSPLDTPLEALDGVSAAVAAALAAEGIKVIADVLEKTDEELLQIKRVGDKSIASLRKACEAAIVPE